MIPIDYGVKVKVTETLNIKSLSSQLLKKCRDAIIGVLVGHDPKMIHIDFAVSRSKVMVIVTLSIKSLTVP